MFDVGSGFYIYVRGQAMLDTKLKQRLVLFWFSGLEQRIFHADGS